MQKLDPRRAVNHILLLQALQAENDYMQDTTAYRHEIKQHAKPLINYIDKYLNDNLETIYSADEECFQNLSRNLDEFYQIARIMAMESEPEDIAELRQIIRMYFHDKEKFKKEFDIVFKELRK